MLVHILECLGTMALGRAGPMAPTYNQIVSFHPLARVVSVWLPSTAFFYLVGEMAAGEPRALLL